MFSEDNDGRRGKIKGAPHPKVIEHISAKVLKNDLATSYQVYLDLNKAHVLMLAKQGIIAPDVAKKILTVTDEMAKMGDTPTFECIPEREDIYPNLEHYLISKVGIEVGGQQHTARSRNDLANTATRLTLRKYYFKLCDAYNKMRQTVLDVARANTDAVMPGYTHLQASEPITFAHYCAAVLGAMDRDYRRIAHAYESLNLNSLGGGSMGSTTWNIDRNYTTELLGFDRPLDNSLDSVASRDYVIDFLAAISIAANTFSRFCFDLYIWCATDYSYIEVNDNAAVCSSIMPQKKNPWTLEHIKAKAGHIEGYFIGAINTLKNTPYTNICDVSGETDAHLYDAIDEMIASIELLDITVAGIKLNKEHMLECARGDFCTVTELANNLVRHDKISFRAAHEIVALIVDDMVTNKKKANEIGVADVHGPFMKLFGKTTVMTDADIQKALDPVLNANSKVIIGGTAPVEVNRQLDVSQKILDADVAENEDRKARVAAAKARMEELVQKTIAS
ncbi:MAG TPA: argininosuccinate lyase [Sutterella sp.]|nr:argininosuccinate lyase [Sutterella sp.]